jgi:hypothetical protein
MRNKDIAKAVGIGGLIVAIITAPIWLPRLLGLKPKRCKCGAKIGPEGIAPYCTCEY